MRPDPLSAAAKPFTVPYEESLESRSARKARKSQQAFLDPSPPSPLSVEFAGWSSEGTTLSLYTTSDEELFESRYQHASTSKQPQQLSPARPLTRARRNSLGRGTFVALSPDVFRFSQTSLDDDIQTTIDRAVENGSTDVDLSHQNIAVLPECVGDLRHCTSLDQPSGRRDFRKSQSESALRFRSTASSQLNLQLPGNLLTSISFPSAFFDIQNLTVLSLRNNKLDSLPEGIGSLVNLRTLNISSNNLQYLPSTILNLQLDTFLCQPNDFFPVPEDAALHPSSRRLLGPKEVRNAVPSLVEACHRLLLAQPDTTLSAHYLKDFPHLAAPLASDYSNSSCKHKRCSNPSHAQKPAIVQPAVERMEWCRVISGCVVGVPEVPILFKGCQRTCLDFLEEAPETTVDDEWTL